jgi:hypothetical protein
MVNNECHTKLTPPCSVPDTAPQTAAALFELHLLNVHQQRHTLDDADLMVVQCHWIKRKACAMYRISRSVRRTVIFSLEILEKK